MLHKPWVELINTWHWLVRRSIFGWYCTWLVYFRQAVPLSHSLSLLFCLPTEGEISRSQIPRRCVLSLLHSVCPMTYKHWGKLNQQSSFLIRQSSKWTLFSHLLYELNTWWTWPPCSRGSFTSFWKDSSTKTPPVSLPISSYLPWSVKHRAVLCPAIMWVLQPS